MMKAIEIKDFSEEYHKGVKAVDNISFDVEQGEIFGFIGHNGAGKSTTIKCLTGQLPITQGSMTVLGCDVTKDPIGAKKKIGFCSDDHAVYENMTGREYVNFIGDVFGVGAEREERIKELVARFHIGYAIDRFVRTYSHGMKQKICLIASLLHSPELWVLDEPLTGLDVSMVREVKQAMLDHKNRGGTVFYSSHNLDVVQKICDKAAFIHRGKLIEVLDIKEFNRLGKSLEDHFFEVTEALDKA